MSYELKSIYFVENFHGIQYFLSLVEPECGAQTTEDTEQKSDKGRLQTANQRVQTKHNLIITSGNPHLEKFLDKIVPGQERMIIPRIPCYRFFVLPFLLLVWRWKYSRILSEKNPTDAYFFGKGSNLHFFVVFRSLEKRKSLLHFVDGSGGKLSEIKIFERNIFQIFYNKLLSLCCGQNLARYKCWAWKHFGLDSFPEPEQINLLDWEAIADKFDLSTEKTNNAVLLVDGPIQEIPGVDIQRTQANIIKYFSDNVKKEIHLKPHISYEHNSFSETSFEHKIKILDRQIPAELIMLKYDEIYFFSSASCYGQKGKSLFSLSKMLEFDSEESRASYWSLFKDYYTDNTAVIMLENANG